MASYTKKNIANFEAFLKSIKLDANFLFNLAIQTLTWNLWVFFLYLRVE